MPLNKGSCSYNPAAPLTSLYSTRPKDLTEPSTPSCGDRKERAKPSVKQKIAADWCDRDGTKSKKLSPSEYLRLLRQTYKADYELLPAPFSGVAEKI